MAGVFYKITQRDSDWNTGYPKEGTLTNDTLMINPVHDEDSTDWDFKVWYGASATYREETGPYEIYAVSEEDYDNAVADFTQFGIYVLNNWANAVYKRFKDGNWLNSLSTWHPTSISSISFIAEQPGGNVPYADLTQKLGATSYTQLEPIMINGRRYPQTLVTVPVYYWDFNVNTNISGLFLKDDRVQDVIKAFVEQIPYDELNTYYEASSATGSVRTVQWEFSMESHHKLYWINPEDAGIPSLTGGNDTLLKIGGSLALGDVWVVGSDTAKGLYGGNGYIQLTVEKLTSGDLKVHTNPAINMTVEDMFDFNYWNGGFLSQIPIMAAASIQCAHGRKGIGIGDVALLRFDVVGEVLNTGMIIINKP